MNDSPHVRYEQAQIVALLDEYEGLHIVPSAGRDLVLAGTLRFQGPGPADQVIEDAYDVEVRVPPGFPDDEPTVRETGGRIPEDYHKLSSDRLCLGAPTAIRLKLRESPTLPAFVKHFVIPYLYGHTYYSRCGQMPYGELTHDGEGICQYLAELFSSRSTERSASFLRLAGMKKRAANKQPCPCGSSKRLGRCHNRRVNHLRRAFGRTWFRTEYDRVIKLLDRADLDSNHRPDYQRSLGIRDGDIYQL